MKLVFKDFDIATQIEDCAFSTLVIENPSLFYEYVFQLSQSLSGKADTFVLAEAGAIFDLKTYAQLIINPVELDFNSKKILSALNAKMKGIALMPEKAELLYKLKQIYEQLIDAYLVETDYPLDHDELDTQDIIKAAGFRIRTEDGTKIEQLYNYLALQQEVLDINIFVLVNLRSYVSDTELADLAKQCVYKKISLILVESHASDSILENERRQIVDRDLCKLD